MRGTTLGPQRSEHRLQLYDGGQVWDDLARREPAQARVAHHSPLDGSTCLREGAQGVALSRRGLRRVLDQPGDQDHVGWRVVAERAGRPRPFRTHPLDRLRIRPGNHAANRLPPLPGAQASHCSTTTTDVVYSCTIVLIRVGGGGWCLRIPRRADEDATRCRQVSR